MATTCDLAAQAAGSGISASLVAVDCIATEVSEQAYGRIFGTDGQLAVALTILLTLYVAFYGLSLMLGRSNLSIRTLLPKMLTLGLVLSFATSFAVFSTFFYGIFVRGPDWLTGVITGSEGSATATFALKLEVVFQAVQQASNGIQDIEMFTPPGMMWMGATLLLLGTVALLVTARIGLALLLAVGPIFVVMALFDGTRGLFTGWLKGLVLLAVTPIFAVIGGSIMLEMAVPILANLVAAPGEIDPQAAMGFFVVGAVHAALMLMAIKITSSMVAGWQVFGLASNKSGERGVDTSRYQPALNLPASVAANNRAAQVASSTALAATGTRRAVVAPTPAATAANDAGSGSSTTTTRETTVLATSSGGGQVEPLTPSTSRTRGIGSRFRSAGAGKALRKSEKIS